MERKSIIIIGAGIAGLSAGCYGEMNGYSTKIFELHDKPGGLCTSWKRKGYTIDGCIHWLVGSGRGSSFYSIWKELGAVQGRRIIDHEEFVRFENIDGRVFTVYTDVEHLEQHMKEIAPKDTAIIQDFCKGIRALTHFDWPVEKAPELYTFIERFKMLRKMFPFMGVWRKWGKVSIQDFAKRFSDHFLREAIPYIFYDLPDFPMVGFMMTLAFMDRRTAGFPSGGSLEFAKSIERRYFDLGGEIHYSSKVTKILVENDCAVGVRLDDGSEHRADIVISAADGYTTIFNMLEGKYLNDEIKNYYEKLPLFPPLVQVSLGVSSSFEGHPHCIAWQLEKPVVLANKEMKWGGAHIYNYDPTLAPPGKTVMTSAFPTEYAYWKKLKENPIDYQREKKEIADTVITLLDQRFPGLAHRVEMVDVATPLTYERYTGNWQGSFEGWLLTTKTLGMRMSKQLPGLRNFYMAGQWVEPGGGVPTAALSGRNVIQIICKRDKKTFVTNIP